MKRRAMRIVVCVCHARKLWPDCNEVRQTCFILFHKLTRAGGFTAVITGADPGICIREGGVPSPPIPPLLFSLEQK